MVAVVGAGHVPGIISSIDKEIDLAPLITIPPPKPAKKIVKWLLPALVLGMIIYGFFSFGIVESAHMLWLWCVISALGAALGALLVLGHPLTILAAGISAPLTMLHPGWVAGIVEAFIRKPRVGDLETIIDDITSLKGWWSNRVSRILLIMAITNIGARLGTAVSAFLIAKMLT
nr:traB: TraB family [uncultured bacterium]